MVTRSQERAWDASGKWCGDGAAKRRPPLEAKHQGCDKQTCGRFICGRCARCMPWCWGTSDERCPTWCDDCWFEMRTRADKKRTRILRRGLQPVG